MTLPSGTWGRGEAARDSKVVESPTISKATHEETGFQLIHHFCEPDVLAIY
jgi:hypothetical protein